MVAAGTPAPIVRRLYTELVAAMKEPAVAEKLTPFGIMLSTSKSPEDFGKLIESEAAWMGAISKKLDLTNN